MFTFYHSDKNSENDFYSVPDSFIRKNGGFFGVINSGSTNGLTKKQIEFLFFDEDQLTMQELICSIPTFLSFSVQKFNLKIMEKIKKWAMDEKIMEGRNLRVDHKKCDFVKINISDRLLSFPRRVIKNQIAEQI